MLNTENTKIRDDVNSLVKIAQDQNSLREFVTSYFMTYDKDKKEWKMEDFNRMIEAVQSMKDLPGVSGQSKANIAQVTSAFKGMGKLVKMEYDKDRSLIGKLIDYALPPKKLPEHVQGARNIVDQIQRKVEAESQKMAKLIKSGAKPMIGGRQ